MAAVLNGSFASPAANADYVVPIAPASSGLLSYLYNGMNGWSMVLTFLLMLVVYDQGELETTGCRSAAEHKSDLFSSQLPLAERFHCRTEVEDSIHWASPRLRLP